MSFDKTIKDIRNSKMRGMARYKLWKVRRDKRFFGPDLEQLARLEVAFAPKEVMDQVPAEQKKEWADALGESIDGEDITPTLLGSL